MPLHVVAFDGGISVSGSADTQKANEVEAADSFDIGPRGQMIVASKPSDYLTLNDNVAAAFSKLWGIFETAGFNFSKVLAVGEGDAGPGLGSRYVYAVFNREGEASPLAFVGGSHFGAVDQGIINPHSNGAILTGADFAGVYVVDFIVAGAAAGVPSTVRCYFVNIGVREGIQPNMGLGLYVLSVTPPGTAPSSNQIGRFDALGTGGAGSLSVPLNYKDGEGGLFGGTNARQLYFRGIISWNNHLFGWGYDASDEQIVGVTGITQANPGVVQTATPHGRVTGDKVIFKAGAPSVGMTQVYGEAGPFTITVIDATHYSIGVNTTAYTAFGGTNVTSVYGQGDGPSRVMFCNLGRPLKWGNDKGGGSGTDRSFTDSDAIVLGDAGEIIRGAIKWAGKLIFGTNKGLHYVGGYGRDSFLTDGATPIMRSYNVVGPMAMIEGPDRALYGVAKEGLWCMPDLGSIPKPLFQQLRDFNNRSNGYWDLIWNDYTRAATYPGTTNQDLVWMAVDWERQQVIVGIPWCDAGVGYGYGTDTVIIKYNCVGGGFTRQVFTGVQYTAAGYFRALTGQAPMKFLGTATAAKATVQRYAYKANPNAAEALSATMPLMRFGPYSARGVDTKSAMRRLNLVLGWDQGGVNQITGITNANPAVVTTSLPHNYSSGQKLDIAGVKGMAQINGGTYVVTVTGANTYSIPVNSTAFGVFDGSSIAFSVPPLSFDCSYYFDEDKTVGPNEQTLTAQFGLSIRAAFPSSPAEGDLWVDLRAATTFGAPTGGDPGIGNTTAGSITPARGGALLWMRRENRPVTITGATKANPCVVTVPSHGLVSAQRVSIRGVVGMTQLNNDAAPGPYTKDYTITVVDADHVSLNGIDSSAFGVYTSGGTMYLAWWQIPGMGAHGARATIPLPVARRAGIRTKLQLLATLLERRFQFEGYGMEPGGGDSA